MKRIMIFALAAAMLLTSLATPAMAYEPARNMRQDQTIEGNRGRNRHRRGKGNDWVGFGIGAALGLALGAGVGNSSRQEHHYYYPQPQPQYYQPAQPTLVYDPNCNCYYYR